MNKKEIRLTTAAYLFACDWTSEQIAEVLETTPRTIARWSKLPVWHAVLDALEYAGDRSLRKLPARDIERESGKQIEYVHDVWTEVIKEGAHPRNAARLTSERTGIPVPKIRRWEYRFGWRDETV